MLILRTRLLFACAVVLPLLGCAGEPKVSPPSPQKPSTLNLSVRVSASAKVASITVSNDSSSAVIVHPRMIGIVVYVDRGNGLIPITQDGSAYDLPLLTGFDCVRLSPGDSFSTNKGLDFRLSGLVKVGETAIAVLHPLRLGNFEAEARKRIQRRYPGELLDSEVRSSPTVIAD